MLHRLRRQLALIGYYSAPRRHTAWSRATDIALVAALVLAWPTVWTVDRGWVSQTPLQHMVGKLYRTTDGGLWASVPAEGYRDPVPALALENSEFVGTFELTLWTEDHGWPFVSSRTRPQARLDLDLFEERRTTKDASLPPDSPLRAAIEAALDEAGHDQVRAALSASEPPLNRRRGGWLGNTVIWSIVLVVAGWVGVSIPRIGWVLLESARLKRGSQRQLEERCTACGYDLRASTFSERCPECGTLLG